jgi:hypothetical protein
MTQQYSHNRADDQENGVHMRSVEGVHTALTLILLTLLVYLFSLTNLDESRRHSVYASLAKAFMFTETRLQAVPVETDVALLSGSRQGMRELVAYLDAGEGRGQMEWESGDLVITLPAQPMLPTDLLGPLSQLAGSIPVMVRVEAYSPIGQVNVEPVNGSLTRAVNVASALTSLNADLDPQRIAAAGYRTPFSIAGGLEASGMHVRVVLEGAEALL